jgi:hypothetical protein
MTNLPPKPPLVHFWNAPCHEGLLDDDLEEHYVRTAPAERLDCLLWKHYRFYQSMSSYIRKCLACRDSARRIGLPSGTKQGWMDFVDETNTYLCTIESRMMYVLEEMMRRYNENKQGPQRKRVHFG